MNILKNTFQALICFIIINAFIGCFGSKPFASGDTNIAKETGKKNFVELKDGNIIESKQIKFVKPGFVLDRDQKFKDEDVVAFQLDNVYYHYTNKYHGYVMRIIKGNINVYKKYEQDIQRQAGTNAYGGKTLFFIQRGNSSDVKIITAGNLKEMIKDYEPAYNLINGLANYNNTSKKLEEAINIYNSKK